MPAFARSMPQDRAPILFYDGECGLCQRAVQWTLRHDRAGVFRYAPLQGATYAALEERAKPVDLSTMVVLDGDRLHLRGDAALAVLRRCGGLWRALAACARIVPRPIRDALYRAVAQRRLAWFGSADACALPDPGSRARFLP